MPPYSLCMTGSFNCICAPTHTHFSHAIWLLGCKWYNKYYLYLKALFQFVVCTCKQSCLYVLVRVKVVEAVTWSFFLLFDKLISSVTLNYLVLNKVFVNHKFISYFSHTSKTYLSSSEFSDNKAHKYKRDTEMSRWEIWNWWSH